MKTKAAPIKQKRSRIKPPKAEIITKVRVLKSNLTIEQQYDKYKNMFARADGHIGIICGYSKTKLIMAVTRGYGQQIEGKDNINIITYKRNKNGYDLVTEQDIIF